MRPLYRLADVALGDTLTDSAKGAAVGVVLTDLVSTYADRSGADTLGTMLLTDDKAKSYIADILLCVGSYHKYHLAWRDMAVFADYLGLVDLDGGD